MHFHYLDRYQHKHSAIHNLDPRLKMVVTLLFIISNLLLPDGAWGAFLLAWGGLLCISLMALLGITYTATRAMIVLPFALTAVTIIFTIPGQPIFSFNLSSYPLIATDNGLIRFGSIVIRSWLSMQMAILLTATTSFPDLTYALRSLYVPQTIIDIISFMYRYLFVLTDEATRLLRARESRMARHSTYRSGGSILWQARVAGHMVGQLFLRSYERADRVYGAMLARGYNSEQPPPALIPRSALRFQDWVSGALAVVILFLLQIIGRF